MNDDKHLIFYIGAYSPETIPMGKLAEYMADFAALLGKDNAVHFSDLKKGSTQILAVVEFEDVPKVTTRLHDIRRGNPPKDAQKIFEQIDKRLANDNATGRIFVESEERRGPGRTPDIPRPRPPEGAELRAVHAGGQPGRPSDRGRRQGRNRAAASAERRNHL